MYFKVPLGKLGVEQDFLWRDQKVLVSSIKFISSLLSPLIKDLYLLNVIMPVLELIRLRAISSIAVGTLPGSMPKQAFLWLTYVCKSLCSRVMFSSVPRFWRNSAAVIRSTKCPPTNSTAVSTSSFIALGHMQLR